MRQFSMMGAVLTVGTVLGVLAPVAGSTAAWADGPRYVTSTTTSEVVFPAGTICDFDFHNVLTVTDRTAIFSDKMIDHFVTFATDTNLATGFTLTDGPDHFTVVTAADGQMKFVGIFFHLRDVSGKLVEINAGQLVFSATGEVLKFTPHINPSDAAVLCTEGWGDTPRNTCPYTVAELPGSAALLLTWVGPGGLELPTPSVSVLARYESCGSALAVLGRGRALGRLCAR